MIASLLIAAAITFHAPSTFAATPDTCAPGSVPLDRIDRIEVQRRYVDAPWWAPWMSGWHNVANITSPTPGQFIKRNFPHNAWARVRAVRASKAACWSDSVWIP